MAGAIGGVFDRAALTYDRVGPPFFRTFAEDLAEAAGLEPAQRVLDLGTGTGRVLEAAIDRGADPDRVVGVDLSLPMILGGNRWLGAPGEGRPLLSQMRAARLGLSSESFDQVLCGFGFDLFQRPLAVLAECRRVLRVGGGLSFTTWTDDCPYFAWLIATLDNCQSRFSIRASAPRSGLGTADGLRALLSRGGFEDVGLKRIEKTFYYADVDDWWASLWSHAPRGVLERFNPQQLEQLEDAARETVGAQIDPRGIPARLSAWRVCCSKSA